MIRTDTVVCSLFLIGALAVIPVLGGAQEVEAVIDYRQSVMQGLQVHTGALRSIRSGAVAYEDHVLAHAVAVQGLADMLSPLFPAGSAEGETRALPAIWDSPAEFSAIVAALRSASADLVTAARAGDGAAIDAAREAVGQTCQTCHRAFRARPTPGGGRGG